MCPLAIFSLRQLELLHLHFMSVCICVSVHVCLSSNNLITFQGICLISRKKKKKKIMCVPSCDRCSCGVGKCNVSNVSFDRCGSHNVMRRGDACATRAQCAHTGPEIQPHRGNEEIKAAGISQKAKLIQILQVDAADWRTFSAAAYEIGANWILCREQCD